MKKRLRKEGKKPIKQNLCHFSVKYAAYLELSIFQMEQMQDICRGSVGPLERTQGSATRDFEKFPVITSLYAFRKRKCIHPRGTECLPF
jgi:hypothetical protein